MIVSLCYEFISSAVRNKQTARGRSTQCTNNSDPITTTSELLLMQNRVTAHAHQSYARRLASDHCTTENHRPVHPPCLSLLIMLSGPPIASSSFGPNTPLGAVFFRNIGDQVYFIKHIHEAYESRLCLQVDRVPSGNSCLAVIPNNRMCFSDGTFRNGDKCKAAVCLFSPFQLPHSLLIVVSVQLANSARLFWSLVGLWRRKFWLLIMRLSRNAMSLHRLSAATNMRSYAMQCSVGCILERWKRLCTFPRR
jgi:hypothetical protein